MHRWVGEDSARRFDDLYNLVCDPAFLVHAYERVASNKGALEADIQACFDQRVMAGIGDAYCSELCFIAGRDCAGQGVV